jgi:hypothetical protein
VADGDAGSVSASSKRIGKRDAKIACMMCGQNVNKSNMARHVKHKHSTGPAKSSGNISHADDSVPIIDVSEVSLIIQDLFKIARQFRKSQKTISNIQYRQYVFNHDYGNRS